MSYIKLYSFLDLVFVSKLKGAWMNASCNFTVTLRHNGQKWQYVCSFQKREREKKIHHIIKHYWILFLMFTSKVGLFVFWEESRILDTARRDLVQASSPIFNVVDNPFQALIQPEFWQRKIKVSLNWKNNLKLRLPFSSECTASLDLPLVVSYRLQSQMFGNFGRRQASFDVLLVGKDQNVGLV